MIILAIQYSVDWWRSIVVALEVFFTLNHSTISTRNRPLDEIKSSFWWCWSIKKMLEAGADGLHHQTCPTSALLLYYISISLRLPPISHRAQKPFLQLHQLTFLRSEIFFIHFYRKSKIQKDTDSRTLKKQESN